MPYTMNNWLADQYDTAPGTYTIEPLGGNQYRILRAGTRTQVGTLLNPTNLNKMEQGISACHNPLYSTPLTTTDLVTHLPANAEKGKLDLTLAGQTVHNFVQNGNFANGTTGWSAWVATIAAATNTLTITGTGSDNHGSVFIVTNVPSAANKKVFVRSRVRVTNSVCSSIRLELRQGSGNTQVISINSPAQNQWYTLTGIMTHTTSSVDTLRLYIRHMYADAATANGKVMEVQEVLAIDLDAHPDLATLTADEINTRLPTWFGGTAHAQHTVVRSVGKNIAPVNNGSLSWWQRNTQGTLSVENGYFKSSNQTGGLAGHGAIKVPLQKGVTYTLSAVGYVPSAVPDSRRLSVVGLRVPLEQYTSSSQLITLNNGTLSFENTTSPTRLSITFTPTADGIVEYALYPIAQNGDVFFKDIQVEVGSTSTPYEPYVETLYSPAVELRSLPNGVKDTLATSGLLTRRVSGAYTLQSADVTSIVALTNVDIAVLSKSNLIGYLHQGTQDQTGSSATLEGYAPRQSVVVDDAGSVGRYYVNPGAWAVIMPKGTTLAQARTELEGKRLWYQLATPTTQQIGGAVLIAESSGSIIMEPSAGVGYEVTYSYPLNPAATNQGNSDLAKILDGKKLDRPTGTPAVNNVPRVGADGMYWSEVPQVATGSYVGNQTNRTINVGFTPRLVFITSDGTPIISNVLIEQGTTAGLYNPDYSPSVNAHSQGFTAGLSGKIVTNGFDLYTSANGSNKTGVTFKWVAIR